MSSISYRRHQPLQQYVATCQVQSTAGQPSMVNVGPSQWNQWNQRNSTIDYNSIFKKSLINHSSNDGRRPAGSPNLQAKELQHLKRTLELEK